MVSLHECQSEGSESESLEELLRSIPPIEPIRVGDSVQVNVKDGDTWHWIPGHIIHVDMPDVKVGYQIACKDCTEIMFVGSKFLSFVPAKTRVESARLRSGEAPAKKRAKAVSD